MKFDAKRRDEERSEGLIFGKKYTVYIGEYTIGIDDEELKMFEKLLSDDGGRDEKKSKYRQYRYNTDKDYFLGIYMAYSGPKGGYSSGGLRDTDYVTEFGVWLWDLCDAKKDKKLLVVKIVAKSPGDRVSWEESFMSKYKALKKKAEIEFSFKDEPSNESYEL